MKKLLIALFLSLALAVMAETTIKVNQLGVPFAASDSIRSDGGKDTVTFIFDMNKFDNRKVDASIQHYTNSSDSVATIFSTTRSDINTSNAFTSFYTLDTIETAGSVYKDTIIGSKFLKTIVEGGDTCTYKIIITLFERKY